MRLEYGTNGYDADSRALVSVAGSTERSTGSSSSHKPATAPPMSGRSARRSAPRRNSTICGVVMMACVGAASAELRLQVVGARNRVEVVRRDFFEAELYVQATRSFHVVERVEQHHRVA